eukprot:926848_1
MGTCVDILTMLTLLLPSHITASYDYSNWTQPSSPTISNLYRPGGLLSHAVGYDNNSRIWLIGRYGVHYEDSYSRQLMSYDIDSNSFTYYSKTELSNPVFGHGDFETQIGDILYILDGVDGNKLSTFNVKTAEFTYYYQNIDIPYAADLGGCLASIEGALFVAGAIGLKYVQVLNLTTGTWIVSPEADPLSGGINDAACIVHPYNNSLYVISGRGRTAIEKLYVGDLAHLSQYHWEFVHNLEHLGQDSPFSSLSSVVYENDIVCIRGEHYVYGVDDVIVIDVTSDTVRFSGHTTLQFGSNVGFIVARNVLYSFGVDSDLRNGFRYLNMSE